MKTFLKSWIINTLAVLVAVRVVPGIKFTDNNFWTPFIAALVLGILNAFIRPVLMFLALPLLLVTLGLFTFVINALLLCVVSLLLNDFKVDGFWAAFWGGLVISIVSGLLNVLTGSSRSRIRIERHRRPPDSGSNGGGPVIDI
ncbi:MAG: phage holin family protein [Verrucomicrobia bacterium]|nr:MAG: phage holin family protein [Verrucomicrobiota bacterium]